MEVVTWFIFIALEILRNFILIKWMKRTPHYGWCVIIRFFGGLGFWFYYYPDPLTMGFGPWVYALFQISSFYFLFDPILALLLKRPEWWHYQGKNSGAFFDKLSKPKYYLLKAACFVVLVLSSIVLICT